ncbi:MAG TPA: MBL fold metallo-hydrolase [Polyangiaceae bacterium]
MLLSVRALDMTVEGVSVGGVYTALRVPELDVLLDIGLAPRSFAATGNVFLSHGHADHIGALNTLLGLRGLGRLPPPRVFLPGEIREPVEAALASLGKIQRRPLEIDAVPLSPGDVSQVQSTLWVRAFRTHHTVPSLGFQFFRRVQKLKPEHRGLSGTEVAERRRAGEDLFLSSERLELAYATDTLVNVLDAVPSLLTSRVLVMECSFLDERKSVESAREKYHVHLSELIERADSFQNECLVLMHFSQAYAPEEVHRILERRCPEHLHRRIIAFAPRQGTWPG